MARLLVLNSVKHRRTVYPIQVHTALDSYQLHFYTPSFARLMSQVIQFDDRYAHKKGILIPEIWFQDALEIFRQIYTFSKNLLEYIDYFFYLRL